MASKIFNRRPYTVNTPSKSDIKDYYFNYEGWKGLCDDKDFIAVDQNTFRDAKNVYVDSEGLLRSRPSLVESATNTAIVTANLCKTYQFEDIYVFVKESKIVVKEKIGGVDVETTLYSHSDSCDVKVINTYDKIFFFGGSEWSVYTKRRPTAPRKSTFNEYFSPVLSQFSAGIETVVGDKNEIYSGYDNQYLYNDSIGIDANIVGKTVSYDDSRQFVFNYDRTKELVEKKFKLSNYINYNAGYSYGNTIDVSSNGEIAQLINIDNEQYTVAYFVSGALLNSWVVTFPVYAVNFTQDGNYIIISVGSSAHHIEAQYIVSCKATEADGTFRYLSPTLIYSDSGKHLLAYSYHSDDVYMWVDSDGYLWHKKGTDTPARQQVATSGIWNAYTGNLVFNSLYYAFTLSSASATDKMFIWGGAFNSSGTIDGTTTKVQDKAVKSDVVPIGSKLYSSELGAELVFATKASDTITLWFGHYGWAELNTTNAWEQSSTRPYDYTSYTDTENNYVDFAYCLDGDGPFLTNKDILYYFKNASYEPINDLDPLPFTSRAVVGIKRIMNGTTPEYYLYTRYSTDTITLTEHISGTVNSFLPKDIVYLNSYFLANGNKLYISEARYDDNGNYLFYFPKKNTNVFDKPIIKLHILSESIVAIFFNDEVQYVTYSSDAGAYVYYKSKIQYSIKDGDEVITANDSTTTIFPSRRGIIATSYQNFIASSEQSSTVLSDNIFDMFKDFYGLGGIKIAKKDFWIFFYCEQSTKVILFDTRNASIWIEELPAKVRFVTTIDDKLYIIAGGKPYNLNVGEENYYDKIGTNKIRIDWFFESQKLHLSALTYYKHISNITFFGVSEDLNSDDNSFNLASIVYSKNVNGYVEKNVEYTVNMIRTYVHMLNHNKVNAYQFRISSQNENECAVINAKPLSLSNISIKYRISGQVR